jgi:hypothetical protein
MNLKRDAHSRESQSQVFGQVARVEQMIPIRAITIFPGASIEYGSKEKDEGRGRITSGFHRSREGEVNVARAKEGQLLVCSTVVVKALIKSHYVR